MNKALFLDLGLQQPYVVGNKDKLQILDVGFIDTGLYKDSCDRLNEYRFRMIELIRKSRVDCIVYETPVFSNNYKNTSSVIEAKGVLDCCISEFNLKVIRYTPSNIKKNITGLGTAKKNLVRKCIIDAYISNIKEICKPFKSNKDDVVDSIAVYITYLKLQKII